MGLSISRADWSSDRGVAFSAGENLLQRLRRERRERAGREIRAAGNRGSALTLHSRAEGDGGLEGDGGPEPDASSRASHAGPAASVAVGTAALADAKHAARVKLWQRPMRVIQRSDAYGPALRGNVRERMTSFWDRFGSAFLSPTPPYTRV